MKRGVITLTTQELSYLRQLVSQGEVVSPELTPKLKDDTQPQSKTKLELNQETVESILDAMGPPSVQSPDAATLRMKLSAFGK